MRQAVRHVIGGVCVVLLTAGLAWAQAGATAQINGTVRDTSGAVLPGVDVTVTQTDTNFTRSAVTDAEGNYLFSNLPHRTVPAAGEALRIPHVPAHRHRAAGQRQPNHHRRDGRRRDRRDGVSRGGDAARRDAQPRRRSGHRERAHRGAAAQRPQRHGPDRAGRRGSAAAGARTPPSRSMPGGQAFAVAGGQAFGVAYLLDGATHNNPYDNLNLPLPFPDALQEFRLETSTTNANNGMHSGASVNVVTKSGTNLLHGDLFEFVRNHRFNATNPVQRDRPGHRRAPGRRPEPQPVRRHARRSGCDRPRLLLRRVSRARDCARRRRTCSPSCRQPRCSPATSRNMPRPQCNTTGAVNLRAPFVSNRLDPPRRSAPQR